MAEDREAGSGAAIVGKTPAKGGAADSVGLRPAHSIIGVPDDLRPSTDKTPRSPMATLSPITGTPDEVRSSAGHSQTTWRSSNPVLGVPDEIRPGAMSEIGHAALPRTMPEVGVPPQSRPITGIPDEVRFTPRSDEGLTDSPSAGTPSLTPYLSNLVIPSLAGGNDPSALPRYPIFRLDQQSERQDPRLADLQAELRAAQDQLRTQLEDLRAAATGDSLVSECEAQLAQLYALEAGLQGTSAGFVADQRAQIAAAIVTSRRMSEAARAAVSDVSGSSGSLAAITAATRDTVSSLGRDLFERRIFDPYLHFASAEDEAAYRQREADARRYIDEQMAKKTPEGDLNAAGATVDRMLDAEAHGAGDSPEFRERWNRLVTTTRRQREAVASAGQSTEEFDRNLATSVRQYLRTKGLSDADIDARLQSARDPLAAVEPYLKTAEDAKALDVAVQSSSARETTSTVTVLAAPGSPIQAAASTSNNDMTVDDVMSTFRAAGVTTTVADTASGHGVGNRSAANTPGGRSGPA